MKKIFVQSVGILNHKAKEKAELLEVQATDGSSCVSKACCGTVDCQCLSKKYCCYVKKAVDFDPTHSMNPKDAKRVDSAIKQVMHAGKECIQESGFHGNVDFDTVGVYISNIEAISDGIESNFKKFHKIKKMDPLFLPHSLGHMAVGFFSIEHKLRGPSSAPSCGLLSGLTTLKSAMIAVEEGLCEGAIAGGSSGNMSDLEMLSLENNNIFKDKVFMEGAAVLSLADEELSNKINKKPMAELISLDFSFEKSDLDDSVIFKKIFDKTIEKNDIKKDDIKKVFFNGFDGVVESSLDVNLYSDLHRPVGGHAGIQELAYVITKLNGLSGNYILLVKGDDNYFASCCFKIG